MKIGVYDVAEEIGRGGMGLVLRAQAPDGRPVAVKLLHRLEAEPLARFERERRILGGLGALEGFVPLLDVGTAPSGQPYLVMPFLPGGTLRRRLDEGPMSVAAAVSLGGALARAVGRAHERGLVHRDLKPENVLFDERGTPLVTDLGLAKHFRRDVPGAGGSASLSRSQALAGTVGYMAPEQQADAKRVGPPADVFALGAILFEALAGHPAFAGGTAFEVLSNVHSGSRARLGRKDVPRWLVAVLDRALDADPAQRFADGGELARALASEGRTSARRLPAWLLAGVLGLAVVALGVVAAGTRRAATPTPSTTTPPPPSETPKPSASPSPTPTPKSKTDPIEIEIDQIELRGRAGGYARAVAELDALLTRAPASGRIYRLRGLFRSRQGDNQGALEDTTRGIALDPRDAQLWANRSSTKTILGDLAGAIADATEAIRLEPRLSVAWAARGDAKRQAGEPVAGLEDLDAALALLTRGEAVELSRYSKEDQAIHGAALHGLRGLALAELGRPREAIEAFNRSLELNPKRASALAGRASCRLDLRDREGASEDVERAIAINPSVGGARLTRARLRVFRDDHVGALEDVDEQIRETAKNGFAWGLRGQIRYARQEYAAALTDLDRALALLPGDLEFLLCRGETRFHLREYPAALVDANELVQRAPGDPRSWRLRALVEVVLKDFTAAVKDCDEAIRLAPGDSALHGTRAMALEESGDFEGALAGFKRARDLVGANPKVIAANEERIRALEERIAGRKK